MGRPTNLSYTAEPGEVPSTDSHFMGTGLRRHTQRCAYPHIHSYGMKEIGLLVGDKMGE